MNGGSIPAPLFRRSSAPRHLHRVDNHGQQMFAKDLQNGLVILLPNESSRTEVQYQEWLILSAALRNLRPQLSGSSPAREGYELLPGALRAYAVPTEERARPSGHRTNTPKRPDLMLVIDTETSVDRSQRLLFGVARLYRKRQAPSAHADRWQLRHEWLFHGDDLEPDALEVLKVYSQHLIAAVVPSKLLCCREFVSGCFYQVAYRADALVVGFNLPFDISRLAVGWGVARKRVTAGGFSLPLIEYQGKDGSRKPNSYRPRIGIKTIDSKRHLIQFLAGRRTEELDRATHGHFLDLRTLVFALTNQSHSLESACRAYGIEYRKRKVEHGVVITDYVDYCREDVDATFRLALAVLADFDQHPISPDRLPLL